MRGMTKKHLADVLDVDINTVWRWAAGRSDPREDTKKKLAELLNTSVAYLIGETNDPARYDTLLTQGMEGTTGNPPLHDVFKNAKLRIDDTLDPASIRYPEFVKVPVLDIKTCAGVGSSHMFEDVEEIGVRLLDSTRVGIISIDENRRPFITKIEGDSMSAAGMPDGTEVVVNPAEDVHSGDAAMVCFGESRKTAIKWVYFKPDDTIEIRSATPGFPVYEYTREQQMNPESPLIIIGRVMCYTGIPKRGI
jgi:transcriptional regulator with XRE-family HTH domain